MEHTSNIMSENINTFKQMSVCRGCLASDRRMISATRYESMYRDLTGLIISPSDGLPQWLCYECSALLEKYVILRNKMIKSHYTLYQYVTQSVPFAYDENKSSHLTQTSISHYKIPGIKTEPEQLEEQIKLDIAEVKVENDYDENITMEERRFEDHLNELTSNSPILELMHEIQRDQGELEEQIKRNIAEVKVENDYDENITMEERRLEDHLNGLTSNSPILELKHEKQRDQGECISVVRELDTQASPYESHVGSEAARLSLRARLLSEEHIIASVPEKSALATHTRDSEDITLTPFSEDCRDSVTGIIDSDVRDSSSCNNIQSYICDKCKKVFNDKILLIAHIREHSVTVLKPFKCDVCMKCFTQKNDLDKHYHIYTGDEPYKCNVCMKCFTHKSSLNKHYRIHTGDKPYKCDVCMKCFGQKNRLDNHYRIHTGDKPYKCDVCMQCFTLKSSLNVHYRIHTGDKPYKCDVCMKCFTHKSSLNQHYRVHTGDKPYKCDVCMKRFNQKGNLDKHHRIHTGDKPYKCDICMKCFTVNTSLNRHYLKHTDSKPQNIE